MSSIRRRFRDDTAASASRAKTVTRTDLAELQASVRRLARSADQTAGTTSSLAPQVDGLRRAFGTLSEVVVEEIDALRAECRGLRSQLTARTQDLEDLETNFQTQARELAAVKSDLAATRNEAATAADTHRRQLHELQEDVARLKAEMADVQDRQTTGETVAKVVDGHSKQLGEFQSAVEVLRTNAAAITEHLQRLGGDHRTLDGTVSALSASHSEATAALAQDVGLLAEHLTKLKTVGRGQHEAVLQRCGAMEKAMETRVDSALASTDQQVAGLTRQIAVHQEQLKTGLAALQRQQDRLRGTLEDSAASTATETKAALSSAAAVEAALKTQIADLRRQVVHVSDETRRQFDATSHAIHAFADVLRISSPLAPVV